MSSEIFKPIEIKINDDALHNKKVFGKVETFYYDAIFSNNYSIVALTNIFHLGKLGIILTGMFIYKDAKLIKSDRRRIPLRYLSSSLERPYIKLKDYKLIDGFIDEDTNEWKYHIFMGDKEQGFDINLEKQTKPWMGKTYLGNWLVIPRFKINGKIYIDKKTIDVSGEGYHDHNIYPIYSPLTNKGYFFGKIPVDKYTITWANVKKIRKKEQTIVVLNINDKFISFDPGEIKFEVESYIESQGKKIPESLTIKIDHEPYYLDVNIKSIDFHYLKIPSVNYWRHHVKNSGELKINSKSYKIDNLEIVEYLKFF